MSKKKGLAGILIGTTVGFVAGILSAKKPGRQTRQELKDAASSHITEMEDRLKELYKMMGRRTKELDSKAKKLSGKSKKEFQSLKLKTVKIKKKIKLVLSDIHDGLAEEEDIKKIIREADDTTRKIERTKKKNG